MVMVMYFKSFNSITDSPPQLLYFHFFFSIKTNTLFLFSLAIMKQLEMKNKNKLGKKKDFLKIIKLKNFSKMNTDFAPLTTPETPSNDNGL